MKRRTSCMTNLETRPEVSRKKIYKLAEERKVAEEDNVALLFVNNKVGKLICGWTRGQG